MNQVCTVKLGFKLSIPAKN